MTAEIRLIFESEEDAKFFIAGWLDGGGEQMCGFQTDYEKSDRWDKRRAKFLFLRKVND